MKKMEKRYACRKNKKVKILIYVLLILVVAGCGGNADEGRILFDRGLEQMRKGNLPSAYHLFHRSASACDERNDSVGSFQAKTYLGLVCASIGKDKEGYGLLKSVSYYHIKEKGNYSSQYYYRMKAYYAFTLDKDYKSAAAYIDSLLVIDRTDFPDNEDWLRMDMANLSEMYLMTGQTDKAWAIIRNLEADSEADDVYLSQTYYIHARLLMQEGKTDSAAVYAEKSLYYSERFNAPDNAVNAMRIIMRRDSLRGDMKAYIRHRDTYDSLNEVTRSGEISYKIAVIQEQHKFEMLLKETERRHSVRMLWLGVLALAAAALSVISILLYKQNRLRLKTEQEEHKRLDSEIEYKRLENELLELKMEQTRRELEQTRNDNAEALRKIAVADDRKDSGTRLSLLEATLNTEHADFMKRLGEAYPQLTHNDILILGFMRMSLTSREMASALGISVDSLQKARYRLRKKLQVNSMADLADLVSGL